MVWYFFSSLPQLYWNLKIITMMFCTGQVYPPTLKLHGAMRGDWIDLPIYHYRILYIYYGGANGFKISVYAIQVHYIWLTDSHGRFILPTYTALIHAATHVTRAVYLWWLRFSTTQLN